MAIFNIIMIYTGALFNRHNKLRLWQVHQDFSWVQGYQSSRNVWKKIATRMAPVTSLGRGLVVRGQSQTLPKFRSLFTPVQIRREIGDISESKKESFDLLLPFFCVTPSVQPFAYFWLNADWPS